MSLYFYLVTENEVLVTRCFSRCKMDSTASERDDTRTIDNETKQRFCNSVLGGHREITNSEFRRQVITRKSVPGELEINLSHNDVKCDNFDVT